MEWSIQNNNANILTHLRELGYSIPPHIIEHHPEALREYFFAEYPLKFVSKFRHVQLPDLETLPEDDLELVIYDEPLNVVDSRSTLKLVQAYHLMWKDISLTGFHKMFLDRSSLPLHRITHIDLSHNNLTSIPAQLLQLPNLESLNVAHNHIATLPSIELWNTDSKLQLLDASHNRIGEDCASPLFYRRAAGGANPFRQLWFVNLSHNSISTFPKWVLHFPVLKHLDLRRNPTVRISSLASSSGFPAFSELGSLGTRLCRASTVWSAASLPSISDALMMVWF